MSDKLEYYFKLAREDYADDNRTNYKDGLECMAREVKRLEADLECERLRLAACSVAALGNFTGCKDEYRSAALDDVLRLRSEVKRLEFENAALKNRIDDLEYGELCKIEELRAERDSLKAELANLRQTKAAMHDCLIARAEKAESSLAEARRERDDWQSQARAFRNLSCEDRAERAESSLAEARREKDLAVAALAICREQRDEADSRALAAEEVMGKMREAGDLMRRELNHYVNLEWRRGRANGADMPHPTAGSIAWDAALSAYEGKEK